MGETRFLIDLACSFRKEDAEKGRKRCVGRERHGWKEVEEK